MITLNLGTLVGILLPILFGLAGAGWLLIQHTAKKAVEHAFARDLKTYENQLAAKTSQQLEKLKHDLSAELDRRSKLLAHEFETLPRVWELIHDAAGLVAPVVRIEKEYLKAEALDALEWNEVVAQLSLGSEGKKKMAALAGPERQREYQRYIDTNDLFEAIKAVSAARNYVLAHSIFIEKNTFEAIWGLVELLYSTTEERREEMLHAKPALPQHKSKIHYFRIYWDTQLLNTEQVVKDRLEKSTLHD